MKEKIEEIGKEITKFDYLFKIGLPIIIVFISFMPYILTRNLGFIDLTKDGNIGSNIGGITAPFVGVLSAILMFFSFMIQIKANKLQLEAISQESEKNKNKEDLNFLYYRITDLQTLKDHNLEVTLINLEARLSSIKKTISEKDSFTKWENTIISELSNFELNYMILFRYTNIYLVIIKKLEEIATNIDIIQKEYITSVMKHEFYTLMNNQNNLLLTTSIMLKNENIPIDNTGFKKLVNSCEEINNFIYHD